MIARVLATGIALAVLLPRVASASPVAPRLRVAVRDLSPRLVERLRIDPRVDVRPWPAPADVLVAPSIRAGDGAALRGIVIVPRDAADLGTVGFVLQGRASDAPRGIRPGATRIESVPWRSAPQIRSLFSVRREDPWRTLVATDGGPAVVERPGRPALVVWLFPLDRRENYDFLVWPAFNYTLHALVRRAAGAPLEPFARWPASPIPRGRVRAIALSVVALLWPLSIALFVFARRRRRHTEAEAAAAWGLGRPVRQAAAGWSRAGFARPLGGLFLFVAVGIVVLAPAVYVGTTVLPRFVQPFPQAQGIWGTVSDVSMFFFWLFDMGTFIAFVKFAAEDRGRNPVEALRAGQFYVWWQVLSGVLQVTGFVLIACFALPQTQYAIFSMVVLLYATVQWPGCFTAFAYSLSAAQRYDFALALNVLEDRVFASLCPIPFVLIFRSWGRAHPVYGEALGAAMGIAVGAYVGKWLTLASGLYLHRRAGLRASPFFAAHFTRKTAQRLLAFGGMVVLGQIAYRAAASVEIVVLARMLFNYTESIGVYNLMELKFQSACYFLVYPFFDSAVAAVSEALGWKKRALAQHYVARYLQWGLLWGAVVSSLLAALGPPLIHGALDARWSRAAELLPIAVLAWTIALPGWVADGLQRGAGRPGIFAIVLTGEQFLRVLLIVLLLPRLQLAGLYWAVVASLSIKVVVAFWVNHRIVLPLRLSPWRHVGAPVTAGLFIYALLRVVAAGWAPTSFAGLLFLFAGGGAAAFLLAFFGAGLLGAWDTHALAEIDDAIRLVARFLRPPARLCAALAHSGAHLTPAFLRSAPDALAHEASIDATAIDTATASSPVA